MRIYSELCYKNKWMIHKRLPVLANFFFRIKCLKYKSKLIYSEVWIFIRSLTFSITTNYDVNHSNASRNTLPTNLCVIVNRKQTFNLKDIRTSMKWQRSKIKPPSTFFLTVSITYNLENTFCSYKFALSFFKIPTGTTVTCYHW